MLRLLGALLLPVMLSGCAAVLVGGLIYDHTKSREQRRTFIAEFKRENLDREKAGLKPLDWCTELYKFDKSWYGEDKTCPAVAAPQQPQQPAPADKP